MRFGGGPAGGAGCERTVPRDPSGPKSGRVVAAEVGVLRSPKGGMAELVFVPGGKSVDV